MIKRGIFCFVQTLQSDDLVVIYVENARQYS